MVRLQRVRVGHLSIQWRSVFVVIFFLLLWGIGNGVAGAEEPLRSGHPELRLSLREAIQAAIDNNVNVRLLKELKVTKHAVMAMVLLGGTMFELGMWRFRRQLA